MEEFDWVTLHC